MEYSYDSERSDMTVVAGDDAYKPEEKGQPSRTQRPYSRPEPLKGVCSAARFMFQREKPVGIRNNVLTGIETVRENKVFLRSRISYHWFIATTLLD